MRKRFQIGCVRKSRDGRYWVGQYREEDDTGNRHHRSKLLGKVSKMTKAKALEKLGEILKPINEAAIGTADPDVTVKDFVENIYLPFGKSGNESRWHHERQALAITSWGRSANANWLR